MHIFFLSVRWNIYFELSLEMYEKFQFLLKKINRDFEFNKLYALCGREFGSK